jgi:hypothetical protein
MALLHSETMMQMLGEKLQCTVVLYLTGRLCRSSSSSSSSSFLQSSHLVKQADNHIAVLLSEQRMSKLGGEKENWNEIDPRAERMKGGGRLGQLTDAVGVELWVLEVEPFLHHRLGLWPRRRLHQWTREGRLKLKRHFLLTVFVYRFKRRKFP